MLDRISDAAAPDTVGDMTAPTVEFIFPEDGAEIEGLVAIEIDATDDTWVVTVELFVDGEPLGTDDDAPYDFEWDTSELWSGTYALKAVAKDSAGNTGEAEISVTVLGECDEEGDCPPTVAFEAPEAGALVRGVVEVRAAAGDDDAVVKVRFLVDGGLLVEDEQVPYKTDWDTAEFDDGSYTLGLVAFDSTDKTASAQIQVVVDNTPPELALLSPPEGEIQHDEILLSAEATDSLQMDRVEFVVDDGEPEAVSEEPWEFTWDGSALAAGLHVVTATAFDAAGNESAAEREFLVDRPPVVMLLAPEEGAMVPGPVTVQAEADDDLGLQTVSLSVDGAWYGDLSSMRGVWEILWTPEYEKAERVLTVTALDGEGQTTTAAVTVQVDYPVTVALQLCVEEVCGALETDTELTGTVQVRAIAADDGAEIASMDFLVDGVPIHQDLEAPYDFAWNTTGVQDGARLLEAVATNALDETGSVEVQVLVNNCDLDHDEFVAVGCGGPDCDDGAAGINPDAADLVGDAADQNCDGMDGTDADGDGHASEVSGGEDCDDGAPLVHPCGDDLPGDGVDGNCDGVDALSCDDCLACTGDGFDGQACVHEPIPDGGACDDGDLCTGDGTCQDLVCLPGEALDCDDQNPCTEDDCLADTGCWHLPLDGAACPGGLCIGDTCCVPDCGGKECGTDSCGGGCGVCPEGLACGAGACQPVICEPGASSCEDFMVKECDPMGVGWNKYPCPPGFACTPDQCLPLKSNLLVIFDTSSSMWSIGLGDTVPCICASCPPKPFPACEDPLCPRTRLGLSKYVFNQFFEADTVSLVNVVLTQFPVRIKYPPVLECNNLFAFGCGWYGIDFMASNFMTGDDGSHETVDGGWYDQYLYEILAVPFPQAWWEPSLEIAQSWMDFDEAVGPTAEACTGPADCPGGFCADNQGQQVCWYHTNPELRALSNTPLGRSMFYAGEYYRRYVYMEGRTCVTDGDCANVNYYCKDGACHDPYRACRPNQILLFTDGEENPETSTTVFHNPRVQAKRFRYGLCCETDDDCFDAACTNGICDPGTGSLPDQDEVPCRLFAPNGEPIQVTTHVIDLSASGDGAGTNQLIAKNGGGSFYDASNLDPEDILAQMLLLIDLEEETDNCIPEY